jgi:hypothetical protein
LYNLCKGVNYRELNDEPVKRQRKKKGEPQEKTKQMLTFEAYWRILSGEREVKIYSILLFIY